MSDPIYAARHRTTCIPGASTATTVKMLVVCMDDPTSTDVEVTCNGVTYTSGSEFTLTAYGVAWTGQLTITGLSAFTQYSWTVTQGSESDSGQCYTTPDVGDDYSLFVGSCDNNTQLSNSANTNPETVTGMWSYIKTYTQTGGLPVAGLVFIDDYGYVTAMNFTDDFTGASGLTATAPHEGTEDGVSLAWLALIGCTGGSGIPLHSELDVVSNNDDLKAHWAREENRAWCRKNINLFPQWGDQDFKGDIGYTSDSQAGSNTRWTTYQVTDGLGAAAWKKFLGYCQPPSAGSADTHANHWTLPFGALTVCTLDQVTNGDGSWNSNAESPVQMTTVYSTDQIDDVLGALTSATTAFKLLAMPSGIRYLGQGNTSLNSYLAQYPLFNQCVIEYKRLFTDDTDSLMLNAQTVGAAANLIVVSGDLHRACVIRHHSDAYASNQGESFEHWQTGTANGSSNFSNSTGLVSGDEFVGTNGTTKAKLLYDEPTVSGKRFHVIRCDVYGSENPKRMVMTLIDRNGVEVFSRQYIQSEGNLSQPVGTPFKQAAAISTNET